MLHTLHSKPATVAAILLPILYGTVRICLDDYRGWLDLGAGGLPYNFWGWLLQWAIKLTLAKRDTISLECYDEPLKIDLTESEKLRNTSKHLAPLPQRPGGRPKVAHWVIPHRQLRKAPTSPALSQVKLPPLDLFSTESRCRSHGANPMQSFRRAFNDLAAEKGAISSVNCSVLERRGDAIFVGSLDTIPTVAARSRGEITHIHESDSSAHAMLSFADCKEVIQKGWGERHALSGSVLPLGYTFLYAPESDTDIEVIRTIMNAAITFMTGS